MYEAGRLKTSYFMSLADAIAATAARSLSATIVTAETVEIPYFEIEVKLSKEAEEKLKNDNETVIVCAIFTGELYNDYDFSKIPEEYKKRFIPMLDFHLLTHNIKLTDTRLARFENLVFPKDLYDFINYKDIMILINISSGRRSTNLNILNTDILIGPISKIKGNKYTLNEGLILEKIKTEKIVFR